MLVNVRTIALLILLLLPVMAEALSYRPRGYITNILAYYPTLTLPIDIEELLLIHELYGKMPDIVKKRAESRVDTIMRKGLPEILRIELLLKDVDAKRLDMLPPDAKVVAIQMLEAYEQLKQEKKEELATFVITHQRKTPIEVVVDSNGQ